MTTEPTREELDAMFKPLIVWAVAYNRRLRPIDQRVEIGDFMFMGKDGEVSMYKHRMSRMYIFIGPDGPLCNTRDGYEPWGADVRDLVEACYR
jgi:hypothetical protein